MSTDDDAIDAIDGLALAPLSPDAFRTIDLEFFTLGPTGLMVKPGTHPPFAAWEAVGQVLRTLERGVAWLVGDWMAYGESAYGDLAHQIIGDFSPETARVYSWVAEKIPPENRDHRLDFGHHQVVAALSPAEQRVWLDRAAAGDGDGKRWSTVRLKQEVRAPVGSGAALEYGVYIGFDSVADRDAVAAEHERAGRQVRRMESAKR